VSEKHISDVERLESFNQQIGSGNFAEDTDSDAATPSSESIPLHEESASADLEHGDSNTATQPQESSGTDTIRPVEKDTKSNPDKEKKPIGLFRSVVLGVIVTITGAFVYLKMFSPANSDYLKSVESNMPSQDIATNIDLPRSPSIPKKPKTAHTDNTNMAKPVENKKAAKQDADNSEFETPDAPKLPADQNIGMPKLPELTTDNTANRFKTSRKLMQKIRRDIDPESLGGSAGMIAKFIRTQKTFVEDINKKIGTLSTQVTMLNESNKDLAKKVAKIEGVQKNKLDKLDSCKKPKIILVGTAKTSSCQYCSPFALVEQHGKITPVADGDTVDGFSAKINGDRLILKNDCAQYSYYPKTRK